MSSAQKLLDALFDSYEWAVERHLPADLIARVEAHRHAAQRLNRAPMPPASRSTDPETSHAAEAEIGTSGLRAMQQVHVLEWVRRWPGLTSRELARKAGADRHMVARRLPDLEPECVRKGDARQCAEGRRQAVTWYPAIARDGTG